MSSVPAWLTKLNLPFVPMATVIFAGPLLGMIVLPLMLFHQIQLIVCAFLARHYANRPGDTA